MEATQAILWKSYKQNQDNYLRDRLIASYRPFLKAIVHSVHSKLPRSVDIMDLESYAYIGLIDAINKFDIYRDIKFETYANYRIRGAIIDGIRKQDWLSRSMRSRIKKSSEENAENFYLDNSISGYGNDTIDEDVAVSDSLDSHENMENTNTSSNSYACYENFTMLSIDDPDFYERKASEAGSYVQNLHEIYLASNNEFEENLENKLYLKKLLLGLTSQEKKIVFLYYFKGKTFREIGKLMKITESRVSQINKKILLYMKKEIRKNSCTSIISV
jgi:RNA polymerase sigma factor for flagellar operon FliA